MSRRRAFQSLLVLNFLIIANVNSLNIDNSIKYEGYKIYEILFEHENKSVKFLENFSNLINDSSIIEKRYESKQSLLTTAIIAPVDETRILKYLQINKIDFKIINQNVAKSIRKERRQSEANYFSSMPNVINFESYQRFDVINNYMDYLKVQYPERVNTISVGKSYEGRDLRAVLITNNLKSAAVKRPLILIDAGIHAREWISTATALYAIQQLVENSTFYEKELQLYDWLIWPVVNPDGYEYSHDYDRLWRKNRHPFPNSTTNCVGADLNRNFNYKWSYSGVSTNPCSQIYAGSSAFSEPESKALRDLLFRVNNSCLFYLTLHSYGNYLLYPWGYEKASPSSWPYLNAVASAGALAINSYTGSVYVVGGAAKTLYPAAGGSDDYALAVAKIPVVICMELASGGNGFDPPSYKIQSIVDESWSGIRAMAMEVNDYPLRNKAKCNSLNFSMIFGVIILYLSWS